MKICKRNIKKRSKITLIFFPIKDDHEKRPPPLNQTRQKPSQSQNLNQRAILK